MRVAVINGVLCSCLLVAYVHHIWRIQSRLQDRRDLLRSIDERLAPNPAAADDKSPTSMPPSLDNSLWSDSSSLINPIDLCSGTTVGRLRLLMLIPTTISNRGRRDVLRSTWASTSQKNTSPIIRHAFLFGSRGRYLDRELQEESREFNDIICYDFVDSYRNLTLKTLVGLNWAATYCKTAEYVYKVDDDNYVNVTNLLNILAKQKSTDNFMMGKVHWKSQASRSPTSKWYVPHWLYPYTRFPPYCDGSGYVMPNHVARDIVRASEQIKPIFLEDVYMGMCMKVLKYQLRYQESMHFPNMIAERDSYHCLPRITSVHRMSSKNVLSIWKECTSASKSEQSNDIDVLLQGQSDAFKLTEPPIQGR